MSVQKEMYEEENDAHNITKKKLELAIKGLESIVEPVTYLREQLKDDEGLDGQYVIGLINNPQFYINRAKEVLKELIDNESSY